MEGGVAVNQQVIFMPSTMRTVLIVSCFSAAAFCQLSAGQNRASTIALPAAGEVGYRPADQSTATLNPPSFIWLHEKEANTYAIQWATHDDFSDAVTADNFVWNTYTHSAPFAPGRYYWRYRFNTKAGKSSNWSTVHRHRACRRGDTAHADAGPAAHERVPQGHPRLFLRPEDLPRLRELWPPESWRRTSSGSAPRPIGSSAPVPRRSRRTWARREIRKTRKP